MAFSPLTPDWEKQGQYWFDLIREYPRDEIYSALVMPVVGTKMSDDAAMFLAWAVALRGAGNVSPNPLVGAVVLDRDGKFLSAGAHLRVGGSHAEISALKRIVNVEDFTDASLFVTLEPCAHEGRTPSCAALLAKTKVGRILYGLKDPNPLVNGQGVDMLLAAGKVVRKMEAWEPYCRWLCRVFLKNFEHQRVFTALKVASTPTGVMAGDQSSRLWITGERAREAGHFLRLEYDAILVGPNTVALDNPTLNIRHSSLNGRTPVRVVLDPQSKIRHQLADLNICKSEPEKTILISPPASQEASSEIPAGIRELALPVGSDGKFLWEDILAKLWELGIRSVLIEGGAGVVRSALKADVVDVIHWFVAPSGPENGLCWDVPEKLKMFYEKGGRMAVGVDKLIEWSPVSGGCP